MFEHHDYLEEYVDMLNDQGQKERIQLYSNMSRIIFNFQINKQIGFLESFLAGKDEGKVGEHEKEEEKEEEKDSDDEEEQKEEENKKNEEEKTKEDDKTKSSKDNSKKATKKTKEELIKASEDLIEDLIEKYVYGKITDRQVAIDRTSNILDLKKASHMTKVINFI